MIYWLTGIILAGLAITINFFRKGGIYNKEPMNTDNENPVFPPENPSPSVLPNPVVETHVPPVQPREIPFPPMIEKWANAIALWEGAKPSSNNEGNLKYGTLTASWGATKGRAAADGGFFCQFATPEAGHKALCNFLILGCENQLLAFHKARTFEAFTKVYAGNPPQNYINQIAKLVGVSLSTDISTFLT
jgi:hypothetical protein